MERRPGGRMETSDFVSAYKMKSGTIDKRVIRAHRRSLDWKKLRHDEVNKRRNMENLSPLQESLDNISANKSYKSKTPVRHNSKAGTPKRDAKSMTPSRDSKPRTPKIESRKEKLLKWRQERDMRRKLDIVEKAKKQPFRVCHVEHSDKEVFKKDKQKKAASTAPVYQALPEKRVTRSSSQSQKDPPKPANTRTTLKTKQPEPKPAPRTDRNRKVTQERFAKTNTVSGRVTRSAATIKVPPNRQTGEAKKLRPRAGVVSEVTKDKDSRTCKKAKDLEISEKDSINAIDSLDVSKVSMARGGESFAPSDFTFAAPCSVSSFVFKPLSPASAANFLYPSQDSSASFLNTTPNRCSTPISGKLIKCSPGEDENKSATEMDSTESSVHDKTVTTEPLPSEGSDKTIRMESSPLVVNGRTSPVDLSETNTVNLTVLREPELEVTLIKDKAEDTNGIEAMDSSETDRTNQTCDHQEKDSSTSDVAIVPMTETLPVNEASDKENIIVESSEEYDKTVSKKCKTPSNVKFMEAAENIPIEEKMVHRKTPVRQTRNSRRTMSATEAFALPANDLPLSVKKSGRKRRRSEHSHPYSVKSPEEWVKLLKQSPMIEMSRRTPKAKKSPGSSPPPPVLNFDDLDESLGVLSTNLAPLLEEADNVPAQDLETTSPSKDEQCSTAVPTEDVEKSVGEIVDTTLGGSGITSDEPMETNCNTTSEEALVAHSDGLNTATPRTPEKLVKDEHDGKIAAPGPTDCQVVGDEVHDVTYFRQLMATESDRFNQICQHWNNVNSSSQLSEDVEGQIRAATGKAQLLIAQRFKQFSSLVDDCEFKRGEKETTTTDLQGFWDMIYFQVEDIDSNFKELETLQANNWVIPEKPIPTKKVVTKKKKTVNPVVKGRSKFAAFRAQMKKPQPAPEDKHFEAGFFTVSSPVRKNLKPHCEGGTPKKSSPCTANMSLSEPQHTNITEPQTHTDSSSTDTEAEKGEEQSSSGLTCPNISGMNPLTPSTSFTPFRTPRRSYVPVVPSPLLNDITPQPKQRRRSCIRKTPMPKRLSHAIDLVDDESKENISVAVPQIQVVEDVSSKKATRRSLRLRKSVCFKEMVETLEESTPVHGSGDDSFSRFLQPSSQQSTPNSDRSSSHTSALDGSPFGSNSPAEESHKSNLKQLPSIERRRSRRSVQFSPLKDSQSDKLPCTPFNSSSLVAQRRVKKRSSIRLSTTPLTANMELEQLCSELDTSEAPAKKSRPSLLYTPPKRRRSSTQTADVPTATLISFTP